MKWVDCQIMGCYHVMENSNDQTMIVAVFGVLVVWKNT